jgi:nitrogen regulatory protein P-II 1
LKKIEAVYMHKFENEVLNALRALHLGGFTMFSGKGRGKGPRKVKEGLGRYIEPFNEIDMVFLVVEDAKVQSIVDAIAKATHTGGLGDGKIFISKVDEVFDISAMKKGEKYL